MHLAFIKKEISKLESFVLFQVEIKDTLRIRKEQAWAFQY